MAQRLVPGVDDLDVVKEYLQIGHSSSDIVLQIMLDAGFEFVQEYTGCLFSTALADIADYVAGGGYNLELPHGPLRSVTSVVDNVASVTVSDGDYDALLGTLFIRHFGQARWDDGHNRFTVTYQAGYTAADLPATLKLAILALCERAYRSPGGRSYEGGAGHSWKWQTLAAGEGSGEPASDILVQLDSYSLKGPLA